MLSEGRHDDIPVQEVVRSNYKNIVSLPSRDVTDGERGLEIFHGNLGTTAEPSTAPTLGGSKNNQAPEINSQQKY